MPEAEQHLGVERVDERTACGRRRIQSTAPPTRYIGSGARPSNTRAPVQVTAKAVNSRALARSIEIASGTEPYMPNSTTEPARSRCAQPHQATAWMPEFWTQANSSSRPSMAST